MAEERSEFSEQVKAIKAQLDKASEAYERGELMEAWQELRTVVKMVEEEKEAIFDLVYEEHLKGAVRDRWKEP